MRAREGRHMGCIARHGRDLDQDHDQDHDHDQGQGQDQDCTHGCIAFDRVVCHEQQRITYSKTSETAPKTTTRTRTRTATTTETTTKITSQ